MDPQIRLTNDGSHTLYLPVLDETYHSMHGAIQESQYVFIGQGLEYYIHNTNKTRVTILEIGLGTGLNAWLSWHYAENHQHRLHYTSVEPFPLEQVLWDQLNYSSIADLGGIPVSFQKLHEVSWDQSHNLSNYFSLKKLRQKIQDFKGPGLFDIVYFDAFAPSKQPEVWSEEVLELVKGCLGSGSCLVTYSAQGQFKRDLQALGFTVSTLPGPPGKKEMTRAILS